VAGKLGELRSSLFDELNHTLGSERFALFQKGMGDWMPLDDEFHGLNTGQAILNVDYRMRFYEPEAGGGSMAWSVQAENHGSYFITTEVEGMLEWLPDHYRREVADWIELARMDVEAESLRVGPEYLENQP
jgi:hypothetical protein